MARTFVSKDPYIESNILLYELHSAAEAKRLMAKNAKRDQCDYELKITKLERKMSRRLLRTAIKNFDMLERDQPHKSQRNYAKQIFKGVIE